MAKAKVTSPPAAATPSSVRARRARARHPRPRSAAAHPPHAPLARPAPRVQAAKPRAQSRASGELEKSLPVAKAASVVMLTAPAPAAAPSADGALPLAARPMDRWLVVWYLVFWFTVMCVGAGSVPGARRARWRAPRGA
jgi:hypothetical protein